MELTCFDDDLDGDDSKGRILDGAYRTASCLEKRCLRSRPLGPIYTPSEMAPINVFVEQGVDCGPAQLTSVTLGVVPVANATTGRSSKAGAQRGASQGHLSFQGYGHGDPPSPI